MTKCRMDIAISVKNVSKQFGEQVVLNKVSHDFERGKIHGVIGNNGSGKTVLFKCIVGFLPVSAGDIYVDTFCIGKDVDFPKDIGIIIETPGFLPNLSGFKNLQILASLKKKITNAQIQQAMQQVDLDPHSKKAVSQYSLGMRQRLGIAQAMMEDPSLFILDEPFNGLDKAGTAKMRQLFTGLAANGKTIVLASHNALDIDLLCDHVCEMDAGNMHVLR